MEELRSLAYLSIGRAVSLCFFGLGLVILSLSYDPVWALKIGGTGSILLCLFLLQRADRAGRTDPRTTEVWTMLAAERRPHHEDGYRMLTEILLETYLRFARWSAGVAALFFGTAFALALVL